MSDMPERHAHTAAYARGDHSPAALTREIDAERRNVSQTIQALQEKFTVGNMVEEVWDNYGPHVNEAGRNLGQAIARNPMPVVVTAVGLAWLIASSAREPGHDRDLQDDEFWGDDEKQREEEFVAIRSRDSDARRPYGTAATTGYYQPHKSVADRVSGAASHAYETASSAGESIASGARNAAGSVSNQAGSAAHGIGDRVRQAAGTARDYAESALESGRDAMDSIGSTARHARERARDAAGRADYYRRQGRRQAELQMREHPLLLGAAAFALGAGIACLLPRSRTEDEYFGEYSDRAWELAREEAEKARRVAGAVAEEAREIAGEEYEALKEGVRTAGEDLRQELSDSASDLAKRATDEAETALEDAGSEAVEIAERLGDAARDEAERQGLIDPDRSA